MRRRHAAHPDLPVDPGDERGPTARPDGRVLVAVALGGALGAPARYLVAEAVHRPAHGFPLATFLVNSAACFALGLVLVIVVERRPASPLVRAFLATGFLGALSTFSTAVVETDLLVRAGRPALAAAYVVASVVAGAVAVVAGLGAGRIVPVREG